MRLAELPATEFNLQITLESGQVFHWQRAGNGWNGLAGNTALYVEQRGNRLLTSAGFEAVTKEYFSLDHPLKSIYESFPKDSFSQQALDHCRGLRILRQPRWECLATFITSSMKQIAHIRTMSLALRKHFGTPVANSLIHAYPTPEQIARTHEKNLRACGLGFRAKNLLTTARMVAEGCIDLESLTKMDTPTAIELLCQLPGVGRKIANCVLLFAYERLDAVPVDVWIGRILRNMRRNRKATLIQLERYSHKRFGSYAGYVQQYLFHHARSSKALPAIP